MKAFLEAGGEKSSRKRKAKDGKGGKEKKKKDPDAPKKPAGGGYGCFLEKMRPEFTKQCAGKPVSAVTKLAYEEALTAYKAKAKEAGDGEEEDEEEEEDEDGE